MRILCFLGIIFGIFQLNAVNCESLQMCFVPQHACINKTIKLIENAKQNVIVLACIFNSEKLARALVQAKKKGVVVEVLVDKENVFHNSKIMDILQNAGILLLIDSHPNIAYSTGMIVDNRHLMLGISGFIDVTKNHISDSILFASDQPNLAIQYVNYFSERKKLATTRKVFCEHSTKCKFNQAASSAKKAASDLWGGTVNFWHKHIIGTK